MSDEQQFRDAVENTAEHTPAKSTPLRAPARTSLEEFTELLKGGEGGDAADGEHESADEAGGEPARKPKKPKTLTELAQALSVKESELYAIEVPSSRAGEKPHTLGALKDLMKQRDDFALASLKLDEDRRSHEREKVSAEEELREVLNSLPADSLSDKAMKKIRDGLEAKRAKARAQILERIPEWQEPTVRESELKAITEHLHGYGIPGTFILANLDANVLQFVRDSVRRAETVRKALELVEERRGKDKPVGKKSSPKAGSESQRSANGGRIESEVSAFRNSFSDRRKH